MMLFLKLFTLTFSRIVPWIALDLSNKTLKMFPLNWNPMLSNIYLISAFGRGTEKSSSITPKPANCFGKSSSTAVVSSA